MFRKVVAVNEASAGGERDVGTPMSMALGIWLCCLALVFLIVAPFFCWKAAGVGALAILGLLLVICFGICTTKVFKKGGEQHA